MGVQRDGASPRRPSSAARAVPYTPQSPVRARRAAQALLVLPQVRRSGVSGARTHHLRWYSFAEPRVPVSSLAQQWPEPAAARARGRWLSRRELSCSTPYPDPRTRASTCGLARPPHQSRPWNNSPTRSASHGSAGSPDAGPRPDHTHDEHDERAHGHSDGTPLQGCGDTGASVVWG